MEMDNKRVYDKCNAAVINIFFIKPFTDDNSLFNINAMGPADDRLTPY